MSLAGRPSKNGNRPPTNVPDDIVWDEDNHPYVYSCSTGIEHHPNCPRDERCSQIELDSESQVDIINESYAWRRASMNWEGVPQGFPGDGIPIELTDLLVWAEVMKAELIELTGITEFEFEEKFRARKLELLRTIRHKHEDRVAKQRAASSLGIVQRPPILGPDGTPIG